MWVLAVALLARAAPSARSAAATSAVFFAVMSVAYYGYAVGVLGFGLRGQLLLLAAWALLSLTAVPLFAVVVHRATRRRGVLPGVVLAGAAAIAVADRTLVGLWSTDPRPVQAVAGVLVALVVAGVLPRHGRTRAVALVLLVPAAVLATLGVDLLYALLPG